MARARFLVLGVKNATLHSFIKEALSMITGLIKKANLAVKRVRMVTQILI